MNSRIPYSMKVFLWIALIGGILACSTNKSTTLSNKEPKKTAKGNLIYGALIRESSTYEQISGTIPRLRAMLSGQFIQYIQDSLGNYGPWLVNEGKDSVMIYQVPVGNPNKDGHWIYNYQYLTSLPDKPIISSFSKMTAINRDSIVLVDYDVPEDFEATVEEIINTPEKVFKDFNFKKLQPSVPLYRVDYVRQTPLHYIGVCENKGGVNGATNQGVSYSYHAITPALYSYGEAIPTENRSSWKQIEQVQFFKKAMIKIQ